MSRLTANVVESFDAPTISADGSRMMLTSSRSVREVWKVPVGPDPVANGQSAVRLLDASLNSMWTNVTRDGRTLLFSNALVGSRDLWTISVNGTGTPRQITTVSGDAVMHSSLSPDGRQVVFASNTAGNADIWVQNVDGSNCVSSRTTRPRMRGQCGRRMGARSCSPHFWTASGGPDGASRWAARQRSLSTDSSGATGSSTRPFWNAGGTSMTPGLRLLDGEHGNVLWQDIKPENGMPMFSPDGKSVRSTIRRIAIGTRSGCTDVARGTGRVAVRFPHQFHVMFRASWIDGGQAFLVNRAEEVSHVVLFDRLAALGD